MCFQTFAFSSGESFCIRKFCPKPSLKQNILIYREKYKFKQNFSVINMNKQQNLNEIYCFNAALSIHLVQYIFDYLIIFDFRMSKAVSKTLYLVNLHMHSSTEINVVVFCDKPSLDLSLLILKICRIKETLFCMVFVWWTKILGLFLFDLCSYYYHLKHLSLKASQEVWGYFISFLLHFMDSITLVTRISTDH